MDTFLPYTQWDAAKTFPAEMRSEFKLKFKEADKSGDWQYTNKIPVDLTNWPNCEFLPYWFYKSQKPILYPEKGSNLIEFFSKQHDKPTNLLPSGFEVEKEVSFNAVGDLMNAAGTENSADIFYRQISHLVFDADLSFANLESTMTTGTPGDTWSAGRPPEINATKEQYDALKGHKGQYFTIVQTANNHILDCGMDGFDTTHDALENDNIYYVGTNRKQSDYHKGRILDINGIRFGFVAATFGVNNQPIPDGKDWMVNIVKFHQFEGPVDLSLLKTQIDWCRSEGADIVVLCLHWGLEHELYPYQEQVDIAHELAECGVDMIIGHHTHCSQPYECYQTNRDPDRIVPIYYSLGNLSSICGYPFGSLSLIANMKIVSGKQNGVQKALIEKFNIIPVIQIQKIEQERNILEIYPLKSIMEQISDIQTRGYQTREYFEEAAKYADMAIGNRWRSDESIV
jgi:poly-gamma-glutamate capsule biosynthesis protein CapA/YwtB (metallophosphatase superfamily)